MLRFRLVAPALLAVASLLLGATPAPAPGVGITVQTVRTSFDLLDTLAIEVVAHNPSSTLRNVTFAGPNEYAIEVSRDGTVLWTSLPPSPPPSVTFAPHTHAFGPGPTPIVLYDWNELTRDRWSPLPGTYTVRVQLLDAARPSASIDVKFTEPLPTTVLAKIKPNEEVTIAGKLDATQQFLTDANGSIALSRRLLAAPPDYPIVIRGFPTDHPDGSRTFTFERWASYGGPLPTPAPVPQVRRVILMSPHPKPTAR
jgi:hypothetical protein